MVVDINKQTRVLRGIRRSPWVALALGLVIAVFYNYMGFSLLYYLALFALGAVLSPLMIKELETGRTKYMILFAVLMAVGNTAIESMKPPNGILILDGVYAGICTLFGMSVVFTIFRKRIQTYLSQSNAWASQVA